MNSRFHLDNSRPRKKFSCPSCQRRRCFTRYVDEDGRVDFPEHVGRCDHLNSCGYHFTPKMYFAEKPLVESTSAARSRRVELPKEVLPSVMETALMERSLTAYHLNPLFRFFCTVMGKDEAKRMFLLYNVGTSKAWGGSTVFWQIDVDGNVRAGKVMGYDPTTGHRIKEPQPQVAWVHSLLKIPLDLKQCLFGEHLLRDRKAQQVVIVESEKSALIGAWKMPEYVWLATGGIHILKPSEAFRAVQHPRSRNATMVVITASDRREPVATMVAITAGDRREPVNSTSHSPLFQEANLFEILPPSWREAEGQNRAIYARIRVWPAAPSLRSQTLKYLGSFLSSSSITALPPASVVRCYCHPHRVAVQSMASSPVINH